VTPGIASQIQHNVSCKSNNSIDRFIKIIRKGFTRYKGLGSILVIGCVLLFTIGRAKSIEKKFG
jgi:hypothetical protein